MYPNKKGVLAFGADPPFRAVLPNLFVCEEPLTRLTKLVKTRLDSNIEWKSSNNTYLNINELIFFTVLRSSNHKI